MPSPTGRITRRSTTDPLRSSPWDRATTWVQRLLGQPRSPAADGWDPILSIQAPLDGLARTRLSEQIMLLATLARASYGSFTGAAQHEGDRSLSEWLQRCARQRKSLASELRGIVMVLAEGNTVAPPWQRWVAEVAVGHPVSWGESWVGRCARGEENLLRLYEQILQETLPRGVRVLLQRQYTEVADTMTALRQRGSG